MTEIRTQTVRTADLPLGGNRTLRLAVTDESLVIAEGYSEGSAFDRPPWLADPISIPASEVPGVIEALNTLIEEAR